MKAGDAVYTILSLGSDWGALIDVKIKRQVNSVSGSGRRFLCSPVDANLCDKVISESNLYLTKRAARTAFKMGTLEDKTSTARSVARGLK